MRKILLGIPHIDVATLCQASRREDVSDKELMALSISDLRKRLHPKTLGAEPKQFLVDQKKDTLAAELYAEFRRLARW